MMAWPVRLSLLAGIAAFGAVGGTLALVGAGLPFLPAAVLMSVAAALLQYAVSTLAPKPPLPDHTAEQAALATLEDYRAQTATLRHDLRGVLSPALMMSDRLLVHPDPAVQRAGNAVVRSIDRATALLAGSRELMSDEPPPPAP